MKILKNTLHSLLLLWVWWLVVFAATAITPFEAWNTLTVGRINELVTKINTLETKVWDLETDNATLQTQIANVYTKAEVDTKISNIETDIASSWDWTVYEITTRVVNNASRTNWIIPVEKDKPLIIWLHWTNQVSRIYYRVTAGSNTWTSPNSTYTFTLSTGTWFRSPSSTTIIPTTTSVTIQVRAEQASRAGTLYAYQ